MAADLGHVVASAHYCGQLGNGRSGKKAAARIVLPRSASHVWFYSPCFTAAKESGRIRRLCKPPQPSVQEVGEERLRVHPHGCR